MATLAERLRAIAGRLIEVRRENPDPDSWTEEDYVIADLNALADEVEGKVLVNDPDLHRKGIVEELDSRAG